MYQILYIFLLSKNDEKKIALKITNKTDESFKKNLSYPVPRAFFVVCYNFFLHFCDVIVYNITRPDHKYILCIPIIFANPDAKERSVSSLAMVYPPFPPSQDSNHVCLRRQQKCTWQSSMQISSSKWIFIVLLNLISVSCFDFTYCIFFYSSQPERVTRRCQCAVYSQWVVRISGQNIQKIWITNFSELIFSLVRLHCCLQLRFLEKMCV